MLRLAKQALSKRQKTLFRISHRFYCKKAVPIFLNRRTVDGREDCIFVEPGLLKITNGESFAAPSTPALLSASRWCHHLKKSSGLLCFAKLWQCFPEMTMLQQQTSVRPSTYYLEVSKQVMMSSASCIDNWKKVLQLFAKSWIVPYWDTLHMSAC